jgi:leader peptidase (prepilin peptidase)/N-methyltransferase
MCRGEKMALLFTLGGLMTGWFLNIVVEKISYIHDNKENEENCVAIVDSKKIKPFSKFMARNIILIIISGILFLISFTQIGLNVILIKALVLNSILIVVSFIDIEYQIIPNKIIIFTLIIGVIFSTIGDISFMSAIFGMLLGGGLLLLLALVPGVLGGGDIKLMFALGMFLGGKGVLVAILLAFTIASFISVLLLILKIKKRKDYIPFGPFLSIGTYIAFHFLI